VNSKGLAENEESDIPGPLGGALPDASQPYDCREGSAREECAGNFLLVRELLGAHQEAAEVGGAELRGSACDPQLDAIKCRATSLRGVRQVILQHFELRSRLTGATSPTGRMLQNAKLGLVGGRERPQMQNYDELITRYAEVTSCMKDLDVIEYTALTMRYTGALRSHRLTETEEYVRAVPRYELHPIAVPMGENGECRGETKSGGMCRLPRLIDSSRCHLHQHQHAEPPVTMVNRAGEEYLCESDLNDGIVLVKGSRTRAPSYEEIGEALGMSWRQVLRRVESAYAKIRARLEAKRGDKDEQP